MENFGIRRRGIPRGLPSLLDYSSWEVPYRDEGGNTVDDGGGGDDAKHDDVQTLPANPSLLVFFASKSATAAVRTCWKDLYMRPTAARADSLSPLRTIPPARQWLAGNDRSGNGTIIVLSTDTSLICFASILSNPTPPDTT